MVLFLLLFFLASEGTASELLHVSVTEVFDGDTIRVSFPGGRSETVRYIGIDTPETHHPHKGVEELGREAYEANRELVSGRMVYLETDLEIRDRYGRLLAYVWTGEAEDRVMVNRILVLKGFAMPFTFPPNIRYTRIFREAFREARKNKRGLWGKASGRNFSPAQVWEELPILAGSFVTLTIKVEKISGSDRRFTLHPPRGKTTLVIYKSDSGSFAPISSFAGKTLKVAGKVTAGFNGAEMVLADPAQIISVR